MDWIKKNPYLVAGGAVIVIGLGVWWYRSSQDKKESFSAKQKSNLNKAGKIAGKVGDIGIKIADNFLGTSFTNATQSKGGLYGTIRSLFR
jgi:hypothetical protein